MSCADNRRKERLKLLILFDPRLICCGTAAERMDEEYLDRGFAV